MAAGQEAAALNGTERAGRYNRPGQRTLYMSGSPEGVAAAMARYGEVARTLMRFEVAAERLLDLRDTDACAELMINPALAKEDWLAAIAREEEPSSWAVSDLAREIGAVGLIDSSRRRPGAWHMVLFGWNEAGGARVTAARPPRE
ncbi:RES family NAD+ phosphorylase [Sphingomonas sp.]|uniref:RES family NAD+ phosphorylase n=1 Tax=Sphingomonas sp. TaxID=28214 RepID=UPI002D807EE2|nr:RES family NAD+ phosphorylase [Sphingomonas sp.]HEU0043146.1 RES family NAD+ phosphorylase [Sphingomonas sp.]